MRSLYTKIMVWMVATIILSFAAFVATSVLLNRRSSQRGETFGRMGNMHMEDARTAYLHGGPKELQEYFARLGRYLPGDHYLLDAAGKDLVSGQDRSELLAHAKGGGPPSWFRLSSGPNVRKASVDNHYFYVSVFTPSFDLWSVLPYYGPVLMVVVLLGYLLAKYLLTPVRNLRETVVQFGQGDLAIRANTKRVDELGDLAHAFDEMAGRIQTLLTAERRLLQDISHELRSPLARLGFAVELARTSPDKESAFARIKQEVNRLSTLVGELLQVTRAEGDPGSRNLEPLRLDQLVQSVAEDCAIEAEVRHCKIVPLNQEAVALRGDPELLRRAVENVLRNAIRHAPEGSKVEVDLEKNGESVALTIRDYGTGVPEDMLDDIFKPFFRVESDRNRNNGGAGLGLAIAQRAVLLHHGELKAENQIPGLLVRMKLPLAL